MVKAPLEVSIVPDLQAGGRWIWRADKISTTETIQPSHLVCLELHDYIAYLESSQSGTQKKRN